jgi:hypothetical protein
MMRVTNRKWIAAGCLIAGVFGGAAGAEVVESTRRARSLDTGLFSLKADDRASFYVTLNDHAAPGPAQLRLQFIDHAGSPAGAQDMTLQPGQSARLHISGPGHFRARAEVLDPAFQFTSGPMIMGTMEVLNLTTEQRGPVCTIHDPGVDGQRQ